MSISSEVSRLATAKANLKNKIQQVFGTTIPDTATIDTFANYISNNADTVDGIHLVVSTAEATADDKSVITFIY
jgi:hypothetical protein